MATEPLTQSAIDAISEDIMASVADILFAGKMFVNGDGACLIGISPEIDRSIRSIERSLSQLSEFITPD
tara:strand:- start:6229 stop:6435 length:207 start_codon:yes stop_codon:yes gene_type:complete